MTRKARNYQAEYARRIANAMARGISRSQARGHARPGEKPSRGPPKPIDDDRLQLAFRVLHQEKNFEAAAKAARISPERLRKHAIERGLIEKSGRRWQARADLPRRVPVFSKGKSLAITVPNAAEASPVADFMSTVGAFLTQPKKFESKLASFAGQSARDIAGKTHPFETNPNTLYRLAAGGERSFEEIYRIIL
jgi:hypothetical protein